MAGTEAAGVRPDLHIELGGGAVLRPYTTADADALFGVIDANRVRLVYSRRMSKARIRGTQSSAALIIPTRPTVLPGQPIPIRAIVCS